MINVLCVDDGPDISRLLELCIASEPDMAFMGCLRSADNLVSEVQARHPDVVLLDMKMPGREPLEALRELMAAEVADSGAMGGVRVIAYSGRDDLEAVRGAVEAGAQGYVAKDCDVPCLLEAIRKVARGGVAFEGWNPTTGAAECPGG